MNKLTAIAIAFMLWTATAFSFDKYLDVNLVTELSHRHEKMHVDVNSEGAVSFGDKTFLVNPKLSLFLDGSMDVSVAAGVRHQTILGAFGHHIFWDSTSTKDGHFNQVGASIDFLTDSFDYRINYYHPITKEQQAGNILSIPHKWVESEIVFKYRYFHVGVGPKYNLFDKEWGTQMRITIPFQHFNVESFISHDNTNGFSGCLSFSFSLYSTPRTSYADAPVSHRSRVQYSKEPIYTTDSQVTKKKEPEETVSPVVPINEDSPDKQPAQEITLPPAPKPPHWYDFLFESQPSEPKKETLSWSNVGWTPDNSFYESQSVASSAAPTSIASVTESGSGQETPKPDLSVSPNEFADWEVVSPISPHPPGGHSRN